MKYRIEFACAKRRCHAGAAHCDRTLRLARKAVGVVSYNIELPCGCVVYVSCHPVTRLAHTRVIQMRSRACPKRHHEVGARLFLWEILPDRRHRPRPIWNDELERLMLPLGGAEELQWHHRANGRRPALPRPKA